MDKDDERYDWKLILAVAAPISLIEFFLFYADVLDFWKWLSLILALAITAAIVYIKDKRRGSIFTAMGVVFLAAIIAKFLKNFGII